MERNVMGELNMHRAAGAKPSFSGMARRHGLDRHTVAKRWREGAEAEGRGPERESALERVRPVVEARAQLPGMTKRAVYELPAHRHGDPPPPGYGAFTARRRRQGIAFGRAAAPEAHPRFETPPGRQLQFDWKEGMRLVGAEGEPHEFSAFTATLGCSRGHVLIPTRSRTTDDLPACLPATFGTPGGAPEELCFVNLNFRI